MSNFDRELFEKILDDDTFPKCTVSELEEQLEAELSKENPDYDLIGEISSTITIMEGKDKEFDIPKKLEEVKQIAAMRKRKLIIPKWFYAVCAAFVVVIGLNAYTVSAWDMNIFSAVIEFTKGGFSVDFNKTEIIELPASENDPYGFIAKLAEYGIESETPHYLPDGFVLTEVQTNVNENVGNTVCFNYWNDKQNIFIDITHYNDYVPKIVIPSDHYNISEREVNGSPAIVSKEDSQYTIAFQKDKTVFYMFTQDVSYDECEKIVESIK